MPQETVGYVELEWTCVHCGTKNEGTRQTCSGCGAPMSDSMKFELPDQQKLVTDKDVLAKAEASPDLHCPYCGTRNPAGSAKCTHCGGDLTGGAARAKGEVLGAFQSAPMPDIKCPFCGTPNPAGTLKCKNCGGTLGSKATPAPTPTVKVPARRIGIIGIAGGLVLVAACIVFLVLMTRTADTSGVVQSLSWQRSIAIQELRPVKHDDWKDQIPSDAQIGSCAQKIRRTQDQPAPGAEKVCGTPYTVDQGSGLGKVVQDCQYNILDSYCDYTVKEWTVVNAVVAKGVDLNPQWPTVSLTNGQRQGKQEEQYQIIFEADGKQYNYSVATAAEFVKFTPGSKWTLTVNGFGTVTSVKPA